MTQTESQRERDLRYEKTFSISAEDTSRRLVSGSRDLAEESTGNEDGQWRKRMAAVGDHERRDAVLPQGRFSISGNPADPGKRRLAASSASGLDGRS